MMLLLHLCVFVHVCVLHCVWFLGFCALVIAVSVLATCEILHLIVTQCFSSTLWGCLHGCLIVLFMILLCWCALDCWHSPMCCFLCMLAYIYEYLVYVVVCGWLCVSQCTCKAAMISDHQFIHLIFDLLHNNKSREINSVGIHCMSMHCAIARLQCVTTMRPTCSLPIAAAGHYPVP
jgi:hypothetical protein